MQCCYAVVDMEVLTKSGATTEKLALISWSVFSCYSPTIIQNDLVIAFRIEPESLIKRSDRFSGIEVCCLLPVKKFMVEIMNCVTAFIYIEKRMFLHLA